MKNKTFITLIILIIFVCSTKIVAQQISGIVSDKDGELPGVTVTLKNSSIGTITGVDGEYSIRIPDEHNAPMLVFSYIGYNTQEIKVQDMTRIDVTMTENIRSLDEVVVVAYGVHKKSDLTSSISVLDADEIAKVPVTNVAQAIQGKIPGVTVISGGSPGAAPSIRIRGVGTINSTEPLTVVDGNPGAPMPDANDIESFQVLKDAAACALYGSRGSNGVILITTKKGSKGKTSINYNGYCGLQWVNKKLDMLTSEEYIRFHQENQIINNLGFPFTNGWVNLSNRILQGVSDLSTINQTDWQNAVFRTAPMSKHAVSVASGNEKSNMFFSGSYLGQDGIEIESEFEKFNFQLNSSAKLGNLVLGENINLFTSNQHNGTSINSVALRQSPLVPIYNNNNLGGFDGATDVLDLLNINNAIAIAHLNPVDIRRDAFSGNVYAELNFLKYITYRGNFVSRISNVTSTSKTLSADFGAVSRSNTTMTVNNARGFNTAIENTLTYLNSFGKHNINAMIGYTREYSIYQSTTTTGDQFNVRVPVSFASLSSMATKSVSGSYYETAMESFLGRVMYDYESKYLFTANLRRDGSSKFGKNNLYGNFPSFSAGWRISEEEFMSNLRNQVDNLKLRVSWGIIGSDFGIDAYNQEVTLNQILKYVLNDQIAPSATMSNIVNQDLKWEEQETVDVGVDLDLFGSQISFIADYYYKKTNGMLISVPIAYSNGMSNMLMNAGDIKNQGVELTLIGRKELGDLKVEGTFNITFEDNEVTRLGHINQPITGGVTPAYKEGVTRTEVGFPIGQFFGYKMIGIYQIGDKDIPAGFAPGDVRYDDMVDGVPGLTANDRTYIGSPFPDFTYNFGLNGTYKNLDFNVFFQGVQGVSIYNESRYWLEGMKDFHGQLASVNNRWTPTNPSQYMPRATQNSTENIRISNRFIEDGSYLRLKSFSIGYNIPQNMLTKYHIQKLRVYVSGQNLLTFSRYSGYDPEVMKSGSDYTNQESKSPNLYRGIDKNSYPVPGSAFFGVEIGF